MIRRFKAMLIITSVAVAIAFALPSTALAATKLSTRIYGLKTSFVVDNSNSTATATAPVATGRLQKYYRSRWVNFSGTVKVYRYNDVTRAWAYVGSRYARAGSNFSFPLTVRGKYKFYYTGNTYNRAATKYTMRKDKIVSAFPKADVSIEQVGDGYWVKVNQVVAWNETAYPGMVPTLGNDLTFWAESENVNDYTLLMPFRTVKTSGTYATSYYVDAADLFPWLALDGAVQFTDDPYVVGASYYYDDISTPSLIVAP